MIDSSQMDMEAIDEMCKKQSKERGKLEEEEGNVIQDIFCGEFHEL